METKTRRLISPILNNKTTAELQSVVSFKHLIALKYSSTVPHATY